MARYKLLISYDGSTYVGWQVQPTGLAIQSQVQGALETILRHPVNVTGSGRTDAGVHALGQVAHFDTFVAYDPHRWLRSLNALLPPSIRIVHIDAVADAFHARYSALSKIYYYYLHLDAVMLPFYRSYRWHTAPLGVKAGCETVEELRWLASHCVGERDFRSFCNRRRKLACVADPRVVHTGLESSVRSLFRLDVVEEPGGVRLEFEANGFLYKMVRNLTGTLVSLLGKPNGRERLEAMFQALDRREGGMAAPPQGLFLAKVCYP